MLLEHMHKKFAKNRTKIKGGRQSGRKGAAHKSKIDLPLQDKVLWITFYGFVILEEYPILPLNFNLVMSPNTFMQCIAQVCSKGINLVYNQVIRSQDLTAVRKFKMTSPSVKRFLCRFGHT